jgi:hypothetical protein
MSSAVTLSSFGGDMFVSNGLSASAPIGIMFRIMMTDRSHASILKQRFLLMLIFLSS